MWRCGRVWDRVDFLQPFETFGHWWYPGSINDRCPGNLRYNPTGGLELTLHSPPPEPLDSGQWPAIHGETALHGPVVFMTSFLKSEELASRKYYAQSAVIGVPPEATSGKWIGRASVHFYNISQPFLWTYYRPHWVEGPRSGSTNNVDVTTFSCTGAEIKVRFSMAMKASVDGASENYYAFPWFDIRFLEPVDASAVLELVHALERGLALLAVRRVVPRNIQVYPATPVTLPSKGTLLTGLRGAEGEFRQPFRAYVMENLLAEGRFGEVLGNWLERSSRFESAAVLVNSGWYQPLHADTSFLMATQAVEAFHRAARPDQGKYVSAEQYESVRSAMVAAIPPGTNRSLKDALLRTLDYGNERSLGSRLKSLRRELPDEVRRKIPKTWANEVVRLRNALTHHQDGEWPIRSSGEVTTLAKLDGQLRALVHFHILRELGVPADPALNDVAFLYAAFN